MTERTDAIEAVGILNSVADALTALGGSGNAGAQLLYQIGNLRANAQISVYSGVLGAQLIGCFSAATAAGATLAGYAILRTTIGALTPSGASGKAIAAAAIELALAQEALILSKTMFVSRDDVDTQIETYDETFDAAETYAANAADVDVYRALVTLHAATVSDLTARSRPLPSLVAVNLVRTWSARSLANKLYGDASRAKELIDENKVVNPSFCALSLVALSA